MHKKYYKFYALFKNSKNPYYFYLIVVELGNQKKETMFHKLLNFKFTTTG